MTQADPRVRNSTSLPHRRAFALPLVILLVVVGAIAVTGMLTRSTQEHAAVQRHVDRYSEHHAQRGVQEIVGLWLKTIQNGDIEEMIANDGSNMAFTVDMGTEEMRVSMREDQSAVLSDFTSLIPTDRQYGLAMLEALAEEVEPERLEELTRDIGPLAVSANSASEEVLRAALSSLEENTTAINSAVDLIMDEREGGPIDRTRLRQIINEAGVDRQIQGRLARLITAEPVLWRVEAEIHGPRLGQARRAGVSGSLIAMYTGLVEIKRQNSRSSEARFQPAGPFLTWEVVNLDDLVRN